MLWLKIWLETRWRIAFMIVLGAIPWLGAATIRNAPTDVRALGVMAFVWIIVPIVLAGSGIQTASGAPIDWTRGAEGSTLFTLSLPVTRSRLFAVRTIAGILETILLLALSLIMTSWLLLPSPGPSLADALRHLAAAGACSLVVYSLSACLSTFIQESWRLRASMLAIALLYVLASMRSLPPWADIFQPFVVQSPLLTHQMPWATIGVAAGLSVMFLLRWPEDRSAARLLALLRRFEAAWSRRRDGPYCRLSVIHGELTKLRPATGAHHERGNEARERGARFPP